ncbi:hypothetical protein [Abyssibacter sp.]|uniref:hypothetical protein n=1 Tax=Abyssibacter sp. TaxID=2320200 RepID=UPI0035192CC1
MRLAVFSVVVYFVVIFSACGGESSEQWVRINDEFLREYFSERLEDFGIQNKLIGEKIYYESEKSSQVEELYKEFSANGPLYIEVSDIYVSVDFERGLEGSGVSYHFRPVEGGGGKYYFSQKNYERARGILHSALEKRRR